MARDPQTLTAVVSRAFSLLVVALIGFGDVQAQVAPGSVHATTVVQDGVPDQRSVSFTPTTAMPKKSSLSGNPLWAIPLGVLMETSARPIFSPSRRPPAPPVVAMPYVPPPKPPTRKEPDQLPLALLGTVIGQSEAIGVFLNKFSNEVIRLRIRENHGGWTLLSADRGGASFEKDNMEVTLTFSRRDAEQPDRSVANDAAPMEQQAVRQ